MIRGYASNGFSLDSIAMYRDMVRSGNNGDNFSYPFVLMACGDLSLVQIGKRIHCKVIVSGYEPDVYVGNSLLAMYAKFGEMGVARKVFDGIPERDLISWNTIISGYVRNCDPEKAISVFSVVAKGKEGLDQLTLVAVLPACANLSALKQGKEIHAYILRSGMEFNKILMNSLMDVYIKSNFMMGSKRLFERMDNKDTVSWNTMISGLACHGDAIESLTLFHRMNHNGFVPDNVTLVAVLGACDKVAALQFGKSLHAYLIRKGLDKGVTVGTSLIDMYAKCGSLACSCQVFDEMPVKNLISWSAMISGYGLHGKGQEAVECFNEMKEKGITPDRVTFTSVLSACSHSGLSLEGKEIFHQISNEYFKKPSVEHYACMVDLLGRIGQLDEAYKLIMNMAVEPNIDVWAALLSACQIHHNVELAEIAAHKAFELKPKSVGIYVALSNIYAKEKKWGAVRRVRDAARYNGLRKPPGCSFVELDMTIHRFLVGDKSHPQSQSIYAKLSELRQQLKESGYTPDSSVVLYEVEEDVKENLLWDHSERLAIAFSLLNTSPGMTIRVTKNLRVCSDCHNVTKLISKLVGREIIVRDAHRFHHFSNGSCSCHDFW